MDIAQCIDEQHEVSCSEKQNTDEERSFNSKRKSLPCSTGESFSFRKKFFEPSYNFCCVVSKFYQENFFNIYFKSIGSHTKNLI